MQKMRNLTQEQSRLDQRAWLGVTSISGKPEGGKKFILQINFKNTGKTPATNMIVRSAVTFSTPIWKGPDFNTIKNIKKEGRGLVFPQAEALSVVDVLPAAPVDPSTIELLNEHKIRIHVFGFAEYDDIFNRHHCTRFCNIYKPEDGYYHACKDYNDTTCP
ncbi:MAG: hypothetical protein ABSC54_04640 [Smithellaceae bacterium]|jgi:hypothetical protein